VNTGTWIDKYAEEAVETTDPDSRTGGADANDPNSPSAVHGVADDEQLVDSDVSSCARVLVRTAEAAAATDDVDSDECATDSDRDNRKFFIKTDRLVPAEHIDDAPTIAPRRWYDPLLFRLFRGGSSVIFCLYQVSD